MKKVKSTVVLKRTDKELLSQDLTAWSLILECRLRVIEEIIQNWAKEDDDEIVLDCVLTKIGYSKSNKQLRFWHGVLKPAFISWCRGEGNDGEEENLVDDLKKELGFTIMRESKVTGEPYLDVMSLAEASMEQARDLIEQTILFLAEHKIKIMTIEEYESKSKNNS